jgi:hypothetical protein
MKHLLALSFCLFYFAIHASYSQAPQVEWQKSFGSYGGDYSNVIRPTTDGGFIVIGTSYFGGGDVTGYHGNMDVGDIWVLKLNNSGDIQWKKCIGTNNFDKGEDIRQTPDGGYIIAATSASAGCFLPGHHGGADYLVIKLTAEGDVSWQKNYGGSQNDYAYSIDLVNDGGYIIGGFTESANGDVTMNHGNRDIWIVKIDGEGNLKWQKSFGGSGDDEASGLRVTDDGGCIVTGYTESNDGDITGNHGKRDIWVVKVDNTGNLQWQKTLGGTASEEGNSIQLTTGGGYIVAGTSASDDGDVSGNHQGLGLFTDFWVVKLNSDGSLQWQKCYGGSFNENAFYVQQANDGGYVVSGSSESSDGDGSCNSAFTDMWVIKISATGQLLWQKSIGGNNSDEAYCAQPLNDGSVIVAGMVSSKDISGYHITPAGTAGDYWILKLSAPLSGFPEAIVNIHPATRNVCKGSTATFTASTLYAGINPKFQWVRNGVNVGTNNPVYSASDFADNDQLVCNISNNSKCDASSFNTSDKITIHINNNTISPQISIGTSNTVICDCSPVIFKASVVNGGLSPGYQWKVNGVIVEDNGSKFISNSLVAGDQVSCVYTDSNSCIINGSVVSNIIQMTEGAMQASAVTITASGDTICAGSDVTFTASAECRNKPYFPVENKWHERRDK